MTSKQTANRRETGKRIARPVRSDDPSHAFSQDAGENRRPAGRFGLSELIDQTQEQSRKSEGVGPSKKAARS